MVTKLRTIASLQSERTAHRQGQAPEAGSESFWGSSVCFAAQQLHIPAYRRPLVSKGAGLYVIAPRLGTVVCSPYLPKLQPVNLPYFYMVSYAICVPDGSIICITMRVLNCP